MIDIHSHIISAIDDGSKNIEMTLEMLRNAERDGTKEIVATPHYLLEYGESTIAEVKAFVEEINSIIKSERINLKVYSGQEVYYNENIIQYYMEGKIGTINDSRYMLIEFPIHKLNKNIINVVYELQIRDIVPIIAHPERYKALIAKPSRINRFINEGYLFQMNAGSLEGKFGADVKKTAKIFLNNGIYNFIGSDAHNIKNRNTGLSNAMTILNKNKRIKDMGKIFEESSKKMLNNEQVNFFGMEIKERKSIFSFLKNKHKI